MERIITFLVNGDSAAPECGSTRIYASSAFTNRHAEQTSSC